MSYPPLLSVAIPTKDRANMFRRALRSALSQTAALSSVEILVSDNSKGVETRCVVEEIGGGNVRYWQNDPPTSMVANWNLLLKEASGEFILWLHDDDFLLPSSLLHVANVLREEMPQRFHVFSAEVVDENEQPLRRGGRHIDAKLDARGALLALFTHSSWIRFPTVVVSVETARHVGGFNEASGDIADLCLWSRLASACGLSTHSFPTAAYTLHSAQTTSRMFEEKTLEDITKLADPFVARGHLRRGELDLALGQFYWRFLLGGAIRALKQRDFDSLRRINRIQQSAVVARSTCPRKWMPIKWALAFAALLK